MGLNFYYYDGLQPEMRAGIINEHECSTNAHQLSILFSLQLVSIMLSILSTFQGFQVGTQSQIREQMSGSEIS